MKVLVSTASFAELDKLPLRELSAHFDQVILNPYQRKIKSDEIKKMIGDIDILIAGTEKINSEVLNNANKLKLISRVGIGVDGIDLKNATKKGIKVTITPDAPSYAVAEFAFGLILSKLRNIDENNQEMHNLKWVRKVGKSIKNASIGIMGYGRIGKTLSNLLIKFNVEKIYINDPYIKKKPKTLNKKIIFCSKKRLLKNSDVVSLHMPLNIETKNIISLKDLKIMKSNACIINTSRGGLINEKDLYLSLKRKIISGAALDVYTEEPYSGKLAELDNCILTSHTSPMTAEARGRMELEAVMEAIRFFKKRKLKNCINQ